MELRRSPSRAAAARTASRVGAGVLVGHDEHERLAIAGRQAGPRRRRRSRRAAWRVCFRPAASRPSKPTSMCAAALAELAGELGHRADADELAGGEDADAVADRLDLARAGGSTAGPRGRARRTSRRRRSRISTTPSGSIAVVGSSRMSTDGDLHQRVGDAEPLEHAPRVRVDARIGALGHADLLEDLVDRRLGLRAVQAVEPRRVAEVLAAGHAVVEADVVGQVADASLDLERMARRVEPEHARRRRPTARSARGASGSSSSCPRRSGRAGRRSRRPGPRGRGCRRRRDRRSASTAGA